MTITLVELAKMLRSGDLVWRMAVALSRGFHITLDVIDHDSEPAAALAHFRDGNFALAVGAIDVRIEDNAADMAMYLKQLIDGRPLPSPQTNADQMMQDALWNLEVQRAAAVARWS